MKFFQRSGDADQASTEDFDEAALPTSTDLNEDVFTSNDAKLDFNKPSNPTVIKKAGYSIEDAIELMKALPRDNNDTVVTVVKKTLESTNIKVADIIDDANVKEERIRNQHKKIEGEIKSLQEQITQRNQQITELMQNLKETVDVRQRLQLAMELDGEKNAVASTEKTSEDKAKPNVTSSTTAKNTDQKHQSTSPNIGESNAGNNPNGSNPNSSNPSHSSSPGHSQNNKHKVGQRVTR
ncbi:hypothetical protein NBRC116493_20170 [Aurantivibrio infirmus]